jgi:predicted deacylase
MKTWEQKANDLASPAAGLSPACRADELIQVSEGIDSNPIAMATITVQGAKPGPRVWLQAQTHGDEPNSTEAILQLLREIVPEELTGTLVAAPAMHTAAFRHLMRESPLDGKNGNRIWGIDWTKLGHTKAFSYIWMHRVSEMIRALKPDLVIDLHDGGVPLKIISHALYATRAAALGPVEELCYKSGMKVVWASSGGRFGGSVNDYMYELGFPAITLESGGTGMLVKEDIDEMAFGLRNVLRTIGMLPGEIEPRPDEQIHMVGADWVRAGRAGLLYRDVQLGQPIRKGGLIGRISNLFGHIIEEVRAPCDGIIFGLRYSAVANIGDYVANVGHLGG